RASTTPMSTITALPSHGSSRCRSQPPTFADRPGPPSPAGALPLAGPPSAFHLASPAWQYLATAATAATRPASPEIDQVGREPKPRKRAIVPSEPVLVVSHEISGGTASMARARPAASRANQPTSTARSD